MKRDHDDRDLEELDAMLSAHLRQRLDPQLGRAAEAFEASAGAAASRRGGTMRLAFATIGLIAAMVTIAWAIWPRGNHAPPPPVVTNTDAMPDAGLPREIERMVLWQTVDDGAAVVADQLPVRKLRQEAVEQVEYYDPHDRATIRVTVPLVRDVMVQMETY
jgi:hypothetical protein